MAAHTRDYYESVNASMSIVTRLFGIVTYLAGSVTLIFGTLSLLLYLAYQWLRDGVWYSYSLADVLVAKDTSENPEQAVSLGLGAPQWFLDASLLAVLPSVGGTLTFVGIVVYLCASFLVGRRARSHRVPR